MTYTDEARRRDEELLCFFTPRLFALQIDGWIPIAPCGKRFLEVAIPRGKVEAVRERGFELRDDLICGPPESLRHKEWEDIVSQGVDHLANEAQRKAQISNDGPRLAAYLRGRFGRPVPWVEVGLLLFDIRSSGHDVQARLCEHLVCLALLSRRPRGPRSGRRPDLRPRLPAAQDTTAALDALERKVRHAEFQRDTPEHTHCIALLRHLLEFVGGPKNDHQRQGLDLDRSITETLQLYGRLIAMQGEESVEPGSYELWDPADSYDEEISVHPGSQQPRDLRASHGQTKALNGSVTKALRLHGPSIEIQGEETSVGSGSQQLPHLPASHGQTKALNELITKAPQLHGSSVEIHGEETSVEPGSQQPRDPPAFHGQTKALNGPVIEPLQLHVPLIETQGAETSVKAGSQQPRALPAPPDEETSAKPDSQQLQDLPASHAETKCVKPRGLPAPQGEEALNRSVTEALLLYSRSIEIDCAERVKPGSRQPRNLPAPYGETEALVVKLQRDFYPIACPAPWNLYRSFSKRKEEAFRTFVKTSLGFLWLPELDDMATASLAILFASKDHEAQTTVEEWTRSPDCRAWFENARVWVKDGWDPEFPAALDYRCTPLTLAAMVRCRSGWPRGRGPAGSVAAQTDVEAFCAFLRCEPVPDEAAVIARIVKSMHAMGAPYNEHTTVGYMARLIENYIDVPQLSEEEDRSGSDATGCGVYGD